MEHKPLLKHKSEKGSVKKLLKLFNIKWENHYLLNNNINFFDFIIGFKISDFNKINLTIFKKIFKNFLTYTRVIDEKNIEYNGLDEKNLYNIGKL